MLKTIINWCIYIPFGLLLLFIAQLCSAAEATSPTSYAPGITLPPGQGKELITQACTKCHDLKGLPAYKGYWNRERWSAMIEIMIKHGAEINQEEANIISNYLAEHFGPN